MHLKIRLLTLILLLGLILSACASSVPVEPEASSVETEAVTETESASPETAAVTTAAKTETTTEEDTSEEETTEEESAEEETTIFHLGITDGVLKYEDVRGYFFRTEFHEDWPQNDYDQSAFTMVNDRMTYDSDRYTYRLGVDVYNEYGHIDWKKVKKDGYDFAIVRIGYRGYIYPDLILDGNWINNLHDAYLAGMDIGVYFFSQAINEEEAEEEAEFVINTLQADGYASEYLKMGIAYDPEYIGSREARSTDLTGEQITKNAKAFCKKIEEAGYKPLIYSNMIWEDRNFNLADLADIDVWYADYTAYPQSPYHFTIWQYGHGKAAGIKGDVDVNIQLIPVADEEETTSSAETTLAETTEAETSDAETTTSAP